MSRGSVHSILTEDLCVQRVSCGAESPDMSKRQNWKLHHDNAPAHSAHVIKSVFGQKQYGTCATASLLS